MKITYKGDYALKALFYLALSHHDSGNGVVSIAELAKAGDMPVKFLEQILLALKQGGFVKSKRGINGGFYIAKLPREITMGDVIRSAMPFIYLDLVALALPIVFPGIALWLPNAMAR